MSAAIYRHAIWLNRLVMGFAIFVFTLIAVRYIGNPVRTEAPYKIVLDSPAAITNARVSGGVFLAMALVLAGAVISRQRHRAALLLLAVFSAVLTAVRLFGLLVDGPAPFTLRVLKPEIASGTPAVQPIQGEIADDEGHRHMPPVAEPLHD